LWIRAFHPAHFSRHQKFLLTAGPIVQGREDKRAAALRADEEVWIQGEIIYAARGAELEVKVTHFYLTRSIYNKYLIHDLLPQEHVPPAAAGGFLRQ
jgi:hypothetical protein